MDGITASMDTNLSKFWEIVKNRATWCAAVHGVPKSWHELVTEFLPLVSHLNTGWYGGGELCLALRLMNGGQRTLLLFVDS